MFLSSAEQKELSDLYIKALDIPPAVSRQIIEQMVVWERCRGINFVMERLKSYVCIVMGKPPTMPISVRSDGSPKGPFGYLCRRATRNRRTRVQVRNALRVYQRWELKATKEVVTKVFTDLKSDLQPKELQSLI